jgi:hypothetical protein
LEYEAAHSTGRCRAEILNIRALGQQDLPLRQLEHAASSKGIRCRSRTR